MGDWFLFYMLGQNVDSMIFKEVRYSKIFKDIQRGKNVDSMIFKEVRGPKVLYQSVHRSLVNFR